MAGRLGTPSVSQAATAISIVHTFWAEAGAMGAGPWGDLTLSADGSTFYGMTRWEAPTARGTIFKINTDGTGSKVLYSFDGVQTIGVTPNGDLTSREPPSTG